MNVKNYRADEEGSKRLLKLADLLEKDAKNENGMKFDMHIWGRVRQVDNHLSCGTTACAMGLAALSGVFKDDGLSYIITNCRLFFRFQGKMVGGVEAAASLFNISIKHAVFLFVCFPGEQKGAEAELYQADRLRDYVAGKPVMGMESKLFAVDDPDYPNEIRDIFFDPVFYPSVTLK